MECHNMAPCPHFGSSDTGDQQVAHGNQNTHTQAQDPDGGFLQAELSDFLSYGDRVYQAGNQSKGLGQNQCWNSFTTIINSTFSVLKITEA
ncbi:hypothetical protein STEG23_018020, partial [Scotinomys teguina]